MRKSQQTPPKKIKIFTQQTHDPDEEEEPFEDEYKITELKKIFMQNATIIL